MNAKTNPGLHDLTYKMIPAFSGISNGARFIVHFQLAKRRGGCIVIKRNEKCNLRYNNSMVSPNGVHFAAVG